MDLGADPRTASLLDWAPSLGTAVFGLFGGQTLGLHVCLIGHRSQQRLRLLWFVWGADPRTAFGLMGTVPRNGCSVYVVCVGGADPRTACCLDWAPSLVPVVFIVVWIGEQTLGLHFA